MKLLVVRHAATISNAHHCINGQRDERLSTVGREQLTGIVESLKGRRIDAIFCSPLKRATETALPVAVDHQTEIVIDRRLIEISAGSLTGKPYEVTIELFGKKSTELLDEYNYDFTVYGGESAQQVRERVQAFLEELKHQPFKSVLVVTHGGILRWINYLCTGERIVGQPNGSVLTLTLGDREPTEL